MEMIRAQCPECGSVGNLEVLRCCFNVVCTRCISSQRQTGSHQCPNLQLFGPLTASDRQKMACQRCNKQQATLICFNCANKQFCKDCSEILHSKGKFVNHKLTQNVHVSSEFECPKHNKQRNLVMENCSLGCVKCAQESKLRKVSIVQDKENYLGLSEEMAMLVKNKLVDIEQTKGMAVAKWLTLEKQLEQDFTLAKEELLKRQKEAMELLKYMMKQEIGAFEEIQKTLVNCSKTLEAFRSVESSGLLYRKISRVKRALMNEVIRKAEKKKISYEGYEYKYCRMNTDSLNIFIKSLGNVDRTKIQTKDDQSINRSSNKLKSISIGDNNRFQNSSNRKRSKSKDLLNTSNISNCRDVSVVGTPHGSMHQRVKSSNRFEGPEERRGLSRFPNQSGSKITRQRSILERKSINAESKEVLNGLNINLFGTNKPTESEKSQNVSSINSSLNSICHSTANPIPNHPSNGSLTNQIRNVKEERFKNDFLHLRESMKKTSSYFNQHRPSILRK